MDRAATRLIDTERHRVDQVYQALQLPRSTPWDQVLAHLRRLATSSPSTPPTPPTP